MEVLIEHIERLLNHAGFPRSLAECGVTAELIPTMAQEAARQWTASFNPRTVTAEDFAALYEAAMQPRSSHS